MSPYNERLSEVVEAFAEVFSRESGGKGVSPSAEDFITGLREGEYGHTYIQGEKEGHGAFRLKPGRDGSIHLRQNMPMPGNKGRASQLAKELGKRFPDIDFIVSGEYE